MYTYPPPRGRDGASIVLAVLLWVFVGWPLSWLLLFVTGPFGVVFGIAITVGLIAFLATSPRRPVPPVVLAPTLPPPSQHQTVRREVEGLAVVDAAGRCGWCGSPSAHVTDEGYPVLPRHWHAAEIEERVRGRLGR